MCFQVLHSLYFLCNLCIMIYQSSVHFSTNTKNIHRYSTKTKIQSLYPIILEIFQKNSSQKRTWTALNSHVNLQFWVSHWFKTYNAAQKYSVKFKDFPQFYKKNKWVKYSIWYKVPYWMTSGRPSVLRPNVCNI